MKADFSGYATKVGIRCSDGLTIMPDAFKHQDKMKVPLVWQHGHPSVENVLGHAILENREDGVYCHCFFNDSPAAKHARETVAHGDINALSIWANQLIKRSNRVIHGAIREVSLVLSGANPGALIETVTLRHSDGMDEALEDEAIIHTGLTFIKDLDSIEDDVEDEADSTVDNDLVLTHAEDVNDQTVQDVYDSMTDVQRNVLHYMIGQALDDADKGMAHEDLDSENATVEEVYNSFTEVQKTVVNYLIGQAATDSEDITQSDLNSNDDDAVIHGETLMEGTKMTRRNVFENGTDADANVLSHADVTSIVTSAIRGGSLKDAVEEYALAHGITDIDTLFPEAKLVSDVPEWNKRRTEWVASLISATRKSPFSRIKTLSADITMEEARAKGYVKGSLKKEEFFTVTKRVTTPTTVYKKQALDRDDISDITDFDVVAWLKGEMRLMLDEELARAILIGDGRDISSEDKINEQNIRPIAKDHELYTTVVTVNVDDASSSMNEALDAVIMNRASLKGTGTPNFYTTEYWLARFLLLRDADGRRIYRTVEELATELRVAAVIPVEAMLEEPDIIGILVNPVDYVCGADQGGKVGMFDDFDIDYNKHKYLIETRMSGALTKLKSAMVLRRTAATNVLAVPVEPTFNPATGALTIPTVTGVVYKHDATTVNAAGSPYTVPAGTTWIIDATPATGYYFATSNDDMWSFTADA